MKLVVISPEADDAREQAVLAALFAAGLARYHVRKPAWSRAQLEAWLRGVPPAWRERLVLHQHHELAAELALGGVHWRDRDGNGPGRSFARQNRDGAPMPLQTHGRDARATPITSRSCHDLATLRAALGGCDSVFFSPLYPSLSKPGYAPRPGFATAELAALLTGRIPAQRRTAVLALGGITIDRLPEVRALGFDGVAVLGAIWQAADPVRTFAALQAGCRREFTPRPIEPGHKAPPTMAGAAL